VQGNLIPILALVLIFDHFVISGVSEVSNEVGILLHSLGKCLVSIVLQL